MGFHSLWLLVWLLVWLLIAFFTLTKAEYYWTGCEWKWSQESGDKIYEDTYVDCDKVRSTTEKVTENSFDCDYGSGYDYYDEDLAKCNQTTEGNRETTEDDRDTININRETTNVNKESSKIG